MSPPRPRAYRHDPTSYKEGRGNAHLMVWQGAGWRSLCGLVADDGGAIYYASHNPPHRPWCANCKGIALRIADDLIYVTRKEDT